MMQTLYFSPSYSLCPECGRKLLFCRRYRRTVKSSSGIFMAVSEKRRCPLHGIYGSGILESIVSSHCTYASDVMIESALQMFIKGRSSSEISQILDTGISDRHVRRLGSIALDIFRKIHEENIPKLREHMKSYILQIDGTTDSEYSMIVVVRDSVSGFVLHVKRCHSESQESIEDIMQSIREKFGMPSGITCDMRAGIISAAGNVFPGIPIRICLMHFLRDLGKDLMENLHRDIGVMINRAGIKSPLKSILREIPDYYQGTLDEIGHGFCSNPGRMEIMAIRKILEDLLSVNGGSGYGFPFSMKNLNFFIACDDAMRKLSHILPRVKEDESMKYISAITGHLSMITGSQVIRETASRLRDINSLIFQSIRKAFMMPDIGNLSIDSKYNPVRDDPLVRDQCSMVFGELEVYLNANIEVHMFQAAKLAIDRYQKRESMLFAQNAAGTIPRTNNNMEIFFRKIRRNVRKRCGNIATGNVLAQSGEALALFQNMGSPEYREMVFGSSDIGSVFARHRKPFGNKEMTRKRRMELADAGTKMILNNTLSSNPYNEKVWAEAGRA